MEEKNNENLIFITPNTSDEVDVLSTLAHEIAHAIDDCQSLHGDFLFMVKGYCKIHLQHLELVY